MRRLARSLFTLCSAVSLLLCVATCVLWVRSYRVSDSMVRRWFDPPHEVARGGPQRVNDVQVWVHAGRASVTVNSRRWLEEVVTALDMEWGDEAVSYWKALPTRPAASGGGTFWRRLGFERSWPDRRGPRDLHDWWQYRVASPLWAPAAVLAVLPAAWAFGRARAARRRVSGLCPSCGYDLRASPEQCPECGVAPSKLGRGG